MVITIGKTFADVTGDKWVYFSSYLGAIGAFFSGSNTVSNLTFGGIQLSIAETTGMSVPLILALQSVGGAMGNMVCLNNSI
ncbi:LctP, partial [Pasteurella multocida subsp. multocida str. Anand1_cattle]